MFVLNRVHRRKVNRFPQNFLSILFLKVYKTRSSCEVVLDSCLSNPCVKGVCVNLEDTSYKCFCLTNYTGARCEINLTYKHCKPDLCLNNGKCIESPLIEGFVCQCPKNYNGILCENSICSNEKCGPNGFYSLFFFVLNTLKECLILFVMKRNLRFERRRRLLLSM